MQQRQLGRGGPMVGAVGLGCWSFGDAYGATSDDASMAALDAALEVGCTHWDTADVYGMGRSERVIGQFLAQHPGVRHRVVIATKGGIRRDPETGARSFDNSPDYLRRALEASLERLGLGAVDLYYVHRRDPRIDIEDVTETLAGFVEEGLVGGIGYSEIAPASLRRAHSIYPVRAVQSEYSLWTRGPELGMVQATGELGVAFVPFSPLARGMLTGHVPRPEMFTAGDFRRDNPRFVTPNFESNLSALVPFNAMARLRGVSPAQLALAWVLAKMPHAIAIPGTRTAGRVIENAGGAGLIVSADDLLAIEQILPPGFAHGERYSQAQSIGIERYG